MGAGEYQRAVDAAAAAGVDLPTLEIDCGDTPWDPALQHLMNEHRVVVHEEWMLDELLSSTLV